MLHAVALIVLMAGAGIRYCPVAWSPVLLAIAALLGLAAWRARREWAKLGMVWLAACFVAVAAFEGYLGHQERAGDGTRMEGTITAGFNERNDVLGYVPDKASRVTARKLYGDEVLYDVAYTIGADGLRVRPGPNGPGTPATSVVFFGDSITFGEGVNDDEAFPYLVGRAGAENFVAYNFAFSGYGPHQMLAILQNGLIESRRVPRPTHFVYLAIVEHVARVAGLVRWDRHGPRYRLDAAGTPVRDGNFDDPKKWFGRWQLPASALAALDDLHTWRRFFGRSRDPDEADLELFISVVIESARLTRELYPGSAFHVILWDGRDDPRIEIIAQRLTAAGIPIERLTSVIPDFTADPSRYLLSPHDGHPNPLMHRRLAEHIIRTLATAAVPETGNSAKR